MSPKTNDRIKNLGTVSGCGLRTLGRDTCDTSFFKENRNWFCSLRKRRVAGVAAHGRVVRLRPFSNGCVFCGAGPLLKRFRATWRQFLARGARTLPPQVGITPMSPGAFHSVCTKALPGLDNKKSAHFDMLASDMHMLREPLCDDRRCSESWRYRCDLSVALQCYTEERMTRTLLMT